MKGHNTCQWLVIGSTRLCGKSCIGEHCKIHLARLRKGPGTKPCQVCGKGVKNCYGLCLGCGYNKAQSRDCERKIKAFRDEFRRLAAIDVSD